MTGARLSALAIALAASLAAAAPARAGFTDRQQIVVTDAVSDLLIASVFSERLDRVTHGVPFYVGLVGAVLGGPIIHAAHDDWGRSGISLGGRVALPIVGAVVGNQLCSDQERHEFLGCLGPVLLGAAVGLVGAQVLDATLVARGSTAGEMPAVRMLSFGVRF